VRKLIAMCVMIALIAGFAALDLVFTTRFYTSAHNNLVAAEQSIRQNREMLANEETILLTHKANNDWEKGKKRLMMLVNHNVVRQVDEKFVSLIEQVESDNYIDAIVTVNVLNSQIKDLREENYPLLRNLL